MEFPRFEYIVWAKETELKEGIHLSGSSMPFLAPENLELDKKTASA